MKHTIASWALLVRVCLAATTTTEPEFDWSTISPSADLEYHPCYDEFQCARLLLPLDWSNASDPSTVALAIAKLPASVPPSSPFFGGTVFTQPGGPGASGTAYLRGNGRKLGSAIDIPGTRNYELLAFDPRGLGESVPRLDCFPGLLGYLRAQERELAAPMDESRESIARLVAAGKADGQRCGEVHGEFLKYTGTANVARDMVAMLDKIEEERERRREAEEQERMEREEEEWQHLELRSASKTKSKKEKKVARLQYIGISYGTFIGTTFASMFPGRVGRLILDGVVNPHGYQDGTATGLDDMDAMLDLFFQGCFDASCPLRQPGDTSADDIINRFWPWASELTTDMPLIISTPDGHRKYVTGDTIRQLFIASLYHPVAEFAPLADALAAAMHDGNTRALFARVLETAYVPIADAVRANFSSSATIWYDRFIGVSCTDGVDVTGRSTDEWQSLEGRNWAVSRLGGPWMTTLQTLCAGWPARPAGMTFTGPYTMPAPSRNPRNPEEGKPAAPILFMSNRWDPVTPLRDARITRDSFPGSGLVIQETIGHCATLSAPGPCAKRFMAEYFLTGSVPEPGVWGREVTCDAPSRFWES